ncbi:hypothetical protein N9061_01380 [bacterium]|nr:hypothetical protein [bacterium]
MQDACRLRAIAKEISELSLFTSAVDANQYFLRISEGGKLVLKALEFGAFGEGTECQEIADELMRQRQLPFQFNLVPTPAGKVPIKYLTAWFAVVDPISPDLLDLRDRRGIDFKNRSMLFDTSAKEIKIVAMAIEKEANRIGEKLATPPLKLLPRPKGKRPKRLDGNPATCKPWIDYEDAIFHYVDGFNVSAGKCWDDQAKKSAMQEVGVDGFSEFNKLHKRTKKRLFKASKK